MATQEHNHFLFFILFSTENYYIILFRDPSTWDGSPSECREQRALAETHLPVLPAGPKTKTNEQYEYSFW